MAVRLWDVDRSGCDEQEVARIVIEHISQLDPTTVSQVAPTQVDQIARAASLIIQRYEFETPKVFAPTPRERILREYASTFGLTSPPKLESERWRNDAQLLSAIERCVTDRPARIVVCSVEPNVRLLEGIANLRRKLTHHRMKVSWLRINSAAGLPQSAAPLQEIVNDAIRWRTSGAILRLKANLKRAGIGIEQTPQVGVRQRHPELL